jgi:hypothetical protein
MVKVILLGLVWINLSYLFSSTRRIFIQCLKLVFEIHAYRKMTFSIKHCV